MKIEIKTLAGSLLFTGDFSGLREALISAVKTGAYLRGAYLQDAYLRGAYLKGAYLQGADLQGAYLRGADLQGADLQGARVNWSSHAMIAEILFRAARADVEKRKIAGLVLISTDWCWDRLLAESEKDALGKWALAELRKWVIAGDDAPEILTTK